MSHSSCPNVYIYTSSNQVCVTQNGVVMKGAPYFVKGRLILDKDRCNEKDCVEEWIVLADCAKKGYIRKNAKKDDFIIVINRNYRDGRHFKTSGCCSIEKPIIVAVFQVVCNITYLEYCERIKKIDNGYYKGMLVHATEDDRYMVMSIDHNEIYHTNFLGDIATIKRNGGLNNNFDKKLKNIYLNKLTIDKLCYKITMEFKSRDGINGPMIQLTQEQKEEIKLFYKVFEEYKNCKLMFNEKNELLILPDGQFSNVTDILNFNNVVIGCKNLWHINKKCDDISIVEIKENCNSKIFTLLYDRLSTKWKGITRNKHCKILEPSMVNNTISFIADLNNLIYNLNNGVLIEKDEDGWYVATVPALKSCYTQARTLEELYPRIKEVIELCIEEETPQQLEFFALHQGHV